MCNYLGDDRWEGCNPGPPQRFYKNGRLNYETWSNVDNQWHRVDGPAQTEYHPNGQIRVEVWLIKDEAHRLDGPAFITYYPSGAPCTESWYVNGEQLEPFHSPLELAKSCLAAFNKVPRNVLRYLKSRGVILSPQVRKNLKAAIEL